MPYVLHVAVLFIVLTLYMFYVARVLAGKAHARFSGFRHAYRALFPACRSRLSVNFFIRLGGHPTELMRAGYWPLLPPSFHIAPWLPIGWGTITLTPCAGGCAIFDDFGKNQTQTNSSSRFFQFANKTYICHPATQTTFATQTIFLIFGFDIGVPPMVFKSHDSIISFTQIIQKKEKKITQETFSK